VYHLDPAAEPLAQSSINVLHTLPVSPRVTLELSEITQLRCSVEHLDESDAIKIIFTILHAWSNPNSVRRWDYYLANWHEGYSR